MKENIKPERAIIMIECPHCDEPLENIEAIDTQFWGNTYYDFCVGECPHCGKQFRWTEVYEFTEVRDIEEVTNS